MRTLVLLLALLFPVGAFAAVTIGVDASGNVAVVNEGQPVSAIPATLNGGPLTAYTLTPAQLAAFFAIPPGNLAKFDGTTISSVAPPTPPPRADVAGFILDCKAAVGGAAAITVARIPHSLLLWETIRTGNWTDVQALIIAAQTASIITAPQYAAIKAAAAARNIPVTLP